MTRETKLGLVVAASFLALVGGVLAVRLHQGGLTTDPDGVAQTGTDAPPSPNPGEQKLEPPTPAVQPNPGVAAAPAPTPITPANLPPLPATADAQTIPPPAP